MEARGSAPNSTAAGCWWGREQLGPESPGLVVEMFQVATPVGVPSTAWDCTGIRLPAPLHWPLRPSLSPPSLPPTAYTCRLPPGPLRGLGQSAEDSRRGPLVTRGPPSPGRPGQAPARGECCSSPRPRARPSTPDSQSPTASHLRSGVLRPLEPDHRKPPGSQPPGPHPGSGRPHYCRRRPDPQGPQRSSCEA